MKGAIAGMYLASRIALYCGTGLDLATTEVGIHRGLKEANPLLGQNRWRRDGMLIGTAIAADLAARRLRVTHPRLATVMNCVLGGMHFSAAAMNGKRIQ